MNDRMTKKGVKVVSKGTGSGETKSEVEGYGEGNTKKEGLVLSRGWGTSMVVLLPSEMHVDVISCSS